jgi:hypothetical protein
VPTPRAGSSTVPLASPPAPRVVKPLVMDVATFMPLDSLALILLDVALPPTEPPEQNVGEPPIPIAGEVICEAVAEPAGKEPRLVVPRPLAPRPLVSRPATPIAAAFGIELGVVLALAGLDGEDNATELPLADVELGELTMPELLTASHGRGVLDPAPKLPGCGDGIELVERVNPPPSKVGSAAVPWSPVEHGPGFAFPEYGDVTLCGLVARPPRPIPSGDVKPIPLGVTELVCAVLSPVPSAMPSIVAAMRRVFISISTFRRLTCRKDAAASCAAAQMA